MEREDVCGEISPDGGKKNGGPRKVLACDTPNTART